MHIRDQVYQEVEGLEALDEVERGHRADALAWIASGVEIFRVQKPATPPKHLVSYFVVMDGDYVLLVDHKKAQRWLPSGGHVEPNEHPRTTVQREAVEELGAQADFLQAGPVMLSMMETVGTVEKHTDVCFWYLLKGDRSKEIRFDESEFNSVKWFHVDEIPYEKSDPNMKRFVDKLQKNKA